MLLIQDNPQHRLTLEKQLGGKFSDNVKILTYINPNGVGIVAYDNMNNLSVDISASGVGQWLTRGLLHHVFKYAFDTNGVKRINAYVEPENHKSIKLITRIGFVKECRLRGIDVDLYSLLPTDTKYYEKP